MFEDEFLSKLDDIFKGYYFTGSRLDDGKTLLGQYGCFNSHPLVLTGHMQNDLTTDEAFHLPATNYMKNRGHNFFSESRKPCDLESAMNNDTDMPSGYMRLEGGGLCFSVRADKESSFGCGLRYLIDPESGSSSDYMALSQLQKLVLQNISGGWPQILLDLWKLIESQINLEGVDYSSQDGSVSSFSVSLVKIIHTKVQEFIRNNINAELGRFGLAIDMDGISALHFFALLYSWKLLCSGQKSRAMKEICNMQQDEENWRTYFISNVCSQPISASKAVAKNMIKSIVNEYVRASQSDTGEEINGELTKYRAQFSSKAIQDELDDTLLFSERSECKLVVDYLTKQTDFVTSELKRRFKGVFSRIKEQVLLRAQGEFQDELKKLQRAVAVLKKFLEDHDMQDMSSKVMFFGGDTNVFDVETEVANQKALDFFTAFCEGGDIATYSRFSDGLYAPNNAAIVQYRDSTLDFSIPLLFHFFDEALTEIGQFIQGIANINWSMVDMGLDHIYNEFKNASIGCPKTCPTCGRKCDQDVNAINHRHACELGHQIRGMSGVRLENDFASTEACEEIKNDRKIFLETENIWCTWYDAKQKHADWDYLSLQENDQRLARILKTRQCWDDYGRAICEHHQNNGIPIKFTPFSKANSNGGTCHYIIVLDESGSMAGVKFRDALNGAVDFGNNLFVKDSRSTLSAVFFDSSARIILKEGDKSSLAQLHSAGYSGGGTNFDIALGTASDIIPSCTKGPYTRHIICFILMEVHPIHTPPCKKALT